MNTLLTSGQVVTVAVGQTYTLKDNEVMINNVLCRKIDVEITLGENKNDSNQANVLVGIRKRDGNNNLPANLSTYDKWQIDGVTQTGISNCVNNINTAIQ